MTPSLFSFPHYHPFSCRPPFLSPSFLFFASPVATDNRPGVRGGVQGRPRPQRGGSAGGHREAGRGGGREGGREGRREEVEPASTKAGPSISFFHMQLQMAAFRSLVLEGEWTAEAVEE